MTAQNTVIHHEVRSVGLSSLKGLAGGADEYNAMVAWRGTFRREVLILMVVELRTVVDWGFEGGGS